MKNIILTMIIGFTGLTSQAQVTEPSTAQKYGTLTEKRVVKNIFSHDYMRKMVLEMLNENFGISIEDASKKIANESVLRQIKVLFIELERKDIFFKPHDSTEKQKAKERILEILGLNMPSVQPLVPARFQSPKQTYKSAIKEATKQ